VSHYSGARATVIDEMKENLMGWFVKLTRVDFWLSLAILLMIETFYEVFLASIVGMKTLMTVPVIAMTWMDWLSIVLNFVFICFIIAFLLATVWFTN
jgi:hypothetical protein